MSLINMNPVIAPGRSFGLGIIAMNGFYKEGDSGLNDDLYFRMSLGINVGQVPVWSKADYWVASMLCGPDTTKGDSIVGSNKILDYVKYGNPPTFLAPKFVDGDTSKICGHSAPSTNVGLGDHLEQLHTPANVSKWSLVAPLENYKGSEKIPGIYYGSFPYNGKSYSSFVDVIQAGLPSKLVANNESDNKSEEIALASFNEKWGRLTEPQVRPLIKTWARDYLQMLSEKFFPRNTLVSSYSGQMQQLSNDSVSMIIYQQGMTALTLLNDMLTRYQNNISRDLLEKGDGVEYSPIAKAFGATNSAFRENLGKTVTIGQVFMYNWNKPEMNLGKILQPF
ncbi:MAG TPA: hypothetical protein PLU50_11910, partial [Pseudobdellovibrionaceae bacterium]|nr:hypothetical protein [Pseudobdellovibrionaceae bacterium]